MSQDLLSYLRASNEQLKAAVARLQGQHEAMMQACARAPSITEEIDSIPGRRIYYHLVGRVNFDLNDDGRRAAPVAMDVSQDGAFVQTHYPCMAWLPTAPANATNFGLWRPVSPYPLPDQATPASAAFDLDEDIISISYEVFDAGSQRNFQNEAVPPLLSRFDNIVPLAVPTLFAPNTTIQVFPTYESIRFSDGAVPPTAGVLVVALPGYRIVNM